jgi:predicted acyltransferase
VPGHGAGKLTPDGNLAIWLDHKLLGSFQDGTPYSWILSSMTFGCTVMLGVFAGQLLRSGVRPWLKAVILLAAGAACYCAGLGWSHWFPIIKHLWTSSFVLFAGGMSLALMGLFYLLIDVWGLWRWAFGFTVIGMNAIAVYMACSLFDFRDIADILLGGLGKWTGAWQDIIRAAGGFALVWLILLYMYKKKTFVKV